MARPMAGIAMAGPELSVRSEQPSERDMRRELEEWQRRKRERKEAEAAARPSRWVSTSSRCRSPAGGAFGEMSVGSLCSRPPRFHVSHVNAVSPLDEICGARGAARSVGSPSSSSMKAPSDGAASCSARVFHGTSSGAHGGSGGRRSLGSLHALRQHAPSEEASVMASPLPQQRGAEPCASLAPPAGGPSSPASRKSSALRNTVPKETPLSPGHSECGGESLGSAVLAAVEAFELARAVPRAPPGSPDPEGECPAEGGKWSLMPRNLRPSAAMLLGGRACPPPPRLLAAVLFELAASQALAEAEPDAQNVSELVGCASLAGRQLDEDVAACSGVGVGRSRSPARRELLLEEDAACLQARDEREEKPAVAAANKAPSVADGSTATPPSEPALPHSTPLFEEDSSRSLAVAAKASDACSETSARSPSDEDAALAQDDDESPQGDDESPQGLEDVDLDGDLCCPTFDEEGSERLGLEDVELENADIIEHIVAPACMGHAEVAHYVQVGGAADDEHDDPGELQEVGSAVDEHHDGTSELQEVDRGADEHVEVGDLQEASERDEEELQLDEEDADELELDEENDVDLEEQIRQRTTALRELLSRHKVTWPCPTTLGTEDHLSRAFDIQIFWFFEKRDRMNNLVPEIQERQLGTMPAILEYPADWPQWRIDSFELRQKVRAGRASSSGPEASPSKGNDAAFASARGVAPTPSPAEVAGSMQGRRGAGAGACAGAAADARKLQGALRKTPSPMRSSKVTGARVARAHDALLQAAGGA